MAAPYYQDEKVTLLLGDALEQIRTLPDGSVDCIVTSPPYYSLRDYGVDGQYGLEDTPAQYCGSGTTGVAALLQGRRYFGIDVNAGYHDLAKERLAQGMFDLGLPA